MPTTLPHLTGLRGAAALLVMVYHYSKIIPGVDVRGEVGLIGHGYLMVDLFFALSGVVMAHVYGERLSTRFRATLLPYLWARVAKLWPVVACSLVLAIAIKIPAIVAGVRTVGTYRDFLLGFVFLGGWDWNGPLWSVVVEFWVYPLLGAILLAWRAPVAIQILIAAGLLAWPSVAQYFGVDAAAYRGADAYLRCLAGFSFGVIGYGLMTRYASIRNALASPAALGILAIFILYTMQFWHVMGATVAALYLFTLGSAWATTRAMALFESRPMLWLGNISFMLYAIHEPVKMLCLGLGRQLISRDPLQVALLLTVAAGVSLFLSDVLRRRVEIPAHARLRRLWS